MDINALEQLIQGAKNNAGDAIFSRYEVSEETVDEMLDNVGPFAVLLLLRAMVRAGKERSREYEIMGRAIDAIVTEAVTVWAKERGPIPERGSVTTTDSRRLN